jgi:hypothetical protein
MLTLCKIAIDLADLMEADYRVRMQIRDSLETNYLLSQNQPSAALIAFQLAFCYHIGFGTKSNDDKCLIWLGKSNKQTYDLKIEKDAVGPAKFKSGRARGKYGLIKVDLVHEYRKRGLNKLEEIRKVYEREVGDMVLLTRDLARWLP